MIVLLAFAVLAGAATAITPCVLPVLPALLSASGSGGRRRPLGVITGLTLTHTITIVGIASVVLEVVELSATFAHPVAAGTVSLRIEMEVGAGGRLLWCEQPLIVAAGTDLVREVRLNLAGAARVLHGDTLVLGREGEAPGRAHSRLRVTRERSAVLDETLTVGPGTPWASPAVLGSARAVAELTLLGVPTDAIALPPDAFVLAGGDVALRRLSAGRRLESLQATELRAAWAAAVWSGSRPS